MYLVPNVIDANVFDVQATVEETTMTGRRFTWRRQGSTYAATPSALA